jgi:WD40 repeat protein
MYGRKNLLSFGGKYVIAACSDPDRNICVWDIEEKSKCLTIGGDAWSNDWIMAIEFCSDGYILSCTNYGKINMWDIDTLEAISWDGHDGVHSICLVDRKRLASGGEDNLVKIWNINIKKAKPSLLYQLGGHTDMIRQVSLIGKSILCSAANDTTVKVWNLDNKKCIATLTHPHSCINVMLMPKSYFLASSDSWNTMKIWSSGMKFLGQGVYECLSRNVFCDVRVQIN